LRPLGASAGPRTTEGVAAVIWKLASAQERVVLVLEVGARVRGSREK
jgi:hypothetical protein